MKKTIVVFCVILAVLGMVGCKQATEETPPANAFVGTWKSDTWQNDGKTVYGIFVFNNDNTYSASFYENDVLFISSAGNYAIPNSGQYDTIPEGASDSLEIVTWGDLGSEFYAFYFLNGILYGQGRGPNPTPNQFTKQ